MITKYVVRGTTLIVLTPEIKVDCALLAMNTKEVMIIENDAKIQSPLIEIVFLRRKLV